MNKRFLVAALILALALSLAACGGGGEATQDAADGAAAQNANGGGGQGSAYPAEWPPDVPKMNGSVLYVLGNDLAGETGVAVTVEANGDAVNNYVNSLASGGFTITADFSDDATRSVQLNNEKYCISLDYQMGTNICAITITDNTLSSVGM